MSRRPVTWGDIYYRWLRKGADNGYAAYMADNYIKRKKKHGNKTRAR